MTVVLAVDLGGSGLRAALIDMSGATKARHFVPMEMPDGGALAECDPAIWWRSLGDCAASLDASAPDDFAHVAAIAICGMTRTNVFVDAQGESVRPAILWNDVRAEQMAADLRAKCDGHPEAAHLNAFHPLARMMWLRSAEPENWARVASVLDPKDFLNLRLAGRLASDPISQARLAAAASANGSGASPFAVAGIETSLVPELLAPLSILGTVRPGLGGALGRLAGKKLVSMANDTWASVLGLGAMRPQIGYNLSGTSEVFGVLSSHAAEAEGLLRVDWSNGLVQTGGPSLAGGDTLAWLASVFGENGAGPLAFDRLDRVLAQPSSGRPLLFLPYLRGERTPYWNPNLRGAWVGLARDHTAADLANAALEGVAFLNRIVLERAEAAAGTRVAEIRFGGGGAAISRWCQIKADILDRPVVTTDRSDHGLVGCAIAGCAALRHDSDIDAAQSRLVGVAHRYTPDRSKRRRYDALFSSFRNAEQALAPISADLATFDSAHFPERF